MNKFNLALFLSFTLFTSSSFVYAQTSDLDNNFLESLPDDVRDDVIKEMDQNNTDPKNNMTKRPSTKLSKLDSIKDWEDFKKKQNIENETERYGLRIFNTMQSSFMPLNEPNFGNNYVIDYGDILKIQLYGSTSNISKTSYETEVQRDGNIVLEEIGSVSLAGLNFDQAISKIKNKYSQSFIGLDVVVTLSEIRDINILITGNVEFPGIYTLSGNSNILQALNVSGGPNEDGSLRSIVIKRKNKNDIKVDLYKALIFGDIDNIPFLMSGDSVYVEPVKNLVRAGYGFNKVAVFEMKDGETIKDLINYAGGLKIEAVNENLNLIRFNKNNAFKQYNIDSNQFSEYKLNNLDSVYAYKENIGVVEITGNVKHPGKYSISSSDRILDIITRSGGYTKPAYPFAASLNRESNRKLEQLFMERAYNNLVTFIANTPDFMAATGNGEGLNYILSELKSYESIGRVITEFDTSELIDNPQSNIYLEDGDAIHIPSYNSNIYVFGEVGNPGSILYEDNLNLNNYITKSGGLNKFSSKDRIFIVSPNGETKKVYINGVRKFIDQDFDIYPGSVIYVPRDIGKVQGLYFYSQAAPIFSSLALSIASLNSLND